MDQQTLPAAVVASFDELRGFYIDELEAGMTKVYVRTVTETDIVQYSQISGDDNPLHVNDEFARRTVFKGRIAHGMLTCAYISALVPPSLLSVSQSEVWAPSLQEYLQEHLQTPQ